MEEYTETANDINNSIETRLLDIAIDLGKGKEEHIFIHEDDNPEEMANAFCIEHNFNSAQRKMLIAQIKEAMEEELRNASESMDVGVDEHINAIIPVMNIRKHDMKSMEKEDLRTNFKVVSKEEDKTQLVKEALIERYSMYNEQSTNKNETRGAYLYNCGLQKKQVKEKLAKCIMDERSLKEMEGVTFKPSINTSKLRKQLTARTNTKSEQRFIQQLQLTKERKAKLTFELMKTWQAKHPFQPNINKR
jgi:hypothetical protein